MSKRIMVVYGTRPEAIKVAPLIMGLHHSSELDPIVVVTGQHREMLDQVNQLFQIKPGRDLDLMVPGATLAELSARAMASVARVVAEEKPDLVVVQGDTSTAFSSSLAAFYEKVPVVHLEAGLRTGSIGSPFPEEANRVLISRLAHLHLAPTATSKDNLVRERVPRDSIVVTGNTVIDALHQATRMPVHFGDIHLARLVESASPFVLVTAHRRESWGEPMREAMTAIREVAKHFKSMHWVVPMHRNPVVRAVIEPALGDLENVHLTEPLTYHEFAHAMLASKMLVTDSGGVQEEAPSLGKPVLVMRESTERPEAIKAGTVRLVGTNRNNIVENVELLLTDAEEYGRMANAVNPYGDGKAAERCVAALEALLDVGTRLPEFVTSSLEISERV